MGNGNNKTYEYLITELYREKWNNKDLSFRDILYKLHIEDNLSYRDLAKLFQVSFSTIYLWCKRENISESGMKW